MKNHVYSDINSAAARPLAGWLCLALVLVAGCAKPGAETATAPMEEAAPAAEAKGGIPIPPGVRDNLGITFAKVELRTVAETRRVPGEFELLPTARQEYRAPLGGRISLHVAQFQAVNAGDLLFTLDSPAWRALQHEAVEAEGEIKMAQAALAVAKAQRAEAGASLGKQEERLANLASAKVRNAALESEATALRGSIPRLEAQVRAQEAALAEAEEHYASRLNALASVTGRSVAELRGKPEEEAPWHFITALEVRAQRAGTVESLPLGEGAWIEEGALALSVVDPGQVRFRAEAPQSDIALFRDGQAASIVLPHGGSVPLAESLRASLTLGLTANAHDRTISLYATPETAAPWARAGVGGYLEIQLADDAPRQLAVPAAAVLQDGLEHVFFRRNPKDPDRAMRVVADLGPGDGRWIVLRSGVKEGDEVVLDGAYALKLAGATQQAPEGYHYHADGALHKDH